VCPEFLREDNSPAFQPGPRPTCGHFETSSQQRPVLCAASIHLVLDASLPRALCAVSTAPPASLTRRRCPCPRLRLVSCHPLQVLRRDNRPKLKSHRYYSIPIGDPKKSGNQGEQEEIYICSSRLGLMKMGHRHSGNGQHVKKSTGIPK
jgi:hypothetical protein